MADSFSLLVLRKSSGAESTLGDLFWTSPERYWLAFTLEDQHQDEKIPGETRIPAGRYPLRLRNWGRLDKRYVTRYGLDFHKGMLEICEVPGFTDILVHSGTTNADTRGCLLLGDEQRQNVTQDGFIGNSRAAYQRVYPGIAELLAAGEEVSIQFVDLA